MKHQHGSIILYALLAIALLGIIGGGLWKARQAGYQAAKLECEEAARAQREAEAKQAAAAATGLEVKREKAKVVYRTITQNVDKIVERPVYRNVCLDADGLRELNAAVRGEVANPTKPDNKASTTPGTK